MQARSLPIHKSCVWHFLCAKDICFYRFQGMD